MPSVYTISMGALNLAAAGAYPLFDVPAQGTYVLRDLVVANNAASPTPALIYYVAPGAEPISLYRTPTQAGETSTRVGLRQVLPPSGVLWAYAGAGNVSVAATGYALGGP